MHKSLSSHFLPFLIFSFERKERKVNHKLKIILKEYNEDKYVSSVGLNNACLHNGSL